MTNWNGHHPSLKPVFAPAIPDLPLCPGAFATCDLPGLPLVPLSITQLVVFGPAHEEAQRSIQADPYPRASGKSPIKNVHQTAAPGLHALVQQGRFQLTAADGANTPRVVHQRMAAKVGGPWRPSKSTASQFMPGTKIGGPAGGL